MPNNQTETENLHAGDIDGADVFEDLQRQVDGEFEAEIEADEVETISEGIFDNDNFSFSDEIAALICESVNAPAEQIGAKKISPESQKFLAARYKRFGKKIAPMFGDKEFGPLGEGMVAILATGAIVFPSIISIRKQAELMQKMMRQQEDDARAKAAKDVTQKPGENHEKKTDTPNPENTL